MTRYREVQACSPLAGYIECFWLLESDAKPALSSPQRILPDGCLELVLHFGDRFRRHREGQPPEEQPRQFLAGQIERAVLLEPTGRIEVVGVRFRPSGAYPFFRVPMDEFTGRFFSLDEIGVKLPGALKQQLVEIRGGEGRIRRLEAWLCQRLAQTLSPARVVEAAVNRMVLANGCVSIRRLSEEVGISSRQLERKFGQWVGLEPKRFCRILRFQGILRAVETGDVAGWAELAVAGGYYDQAHFIREFKEFSGQTPPAFFSEENLWAHLFARKHRKSDSYNTI